MSEVDPEDSISQVSSTVSARKSIHVEAELEALRERQKLEVEELRSKQKRIEIELKLKLRMKEAEGVTPVEEKDDNGVTTEMINPLEREILKHLKVGQESQRQLLESINLPPAELMKFDGDPLRYFEFIRSFEYVVGSSSLSSSGKLMRLMHCCEGVAKRVIKSCLMMPPDIGYDKARELLMERFGDGFKIQEAWLRRVTDGPMITNDCKHLREFADELRICSETLQAMGMIQEISTQRELVRIIERLPFSMRTRWLKVVRMIRETGRVPNIYDVVRFVSDAAEEMNDPVFGSLVQGTSSDRQGAKPKEKGLTVKGRSMMKSSFSASVAEQNCSLCHADHGLFGCQKFKDLTPEQRFEHARDHKLCFSCLKSGHLSSRCRLDRTCSVMGCGKKHTKFLHTGKQTRSNHGDERGTSNKVVSNNHSHSESQAVTSQPDGQAASSHANSRTGAGRIRVALPIVPVKVRAPDGRISVDTFALLDNGSTNSFCQKELADQLKVHGKNEVLSVSTLEKRGSQINCQAVNLKVSGLTSGGVELDIEAYTRPKLNISMDNMARETDVSKFSHLQDLDLPVINCSQVTMLIGQDIPEALLPLEVKSGAPGEPFAVKTVLGWTLNGPLGQKIERDTSIHATACQVNFIDCLDEQVKKFWEVEFTSFQTDKPVSQSDLKTIEIWKKSIQKVDGHFQLAIPFKQHPPCLENNKNVAERRLSVLGRRLKSDAVLYKQYKEGIESLLEKGYAQEVMKEAMNAQTEWYIPHHPVFHPKKGKLRIVFDCAAKFRGTSLNQVVRQGPDLTNNLVGVLLRFRQSPLAIMGDIEAMFHQVQVPPEERDVLRFLWWPEGNLEENPQTYRMCVHLFGGTWSPSACSYALRQAAKDIEIDDDRHDAAMTVSKSFYVDDYLASVEDESTAVKRVSDMTSLLKDAGFRLTKWISNSPAVLESVPEEERAKEVKGLDLNIDALPVERALGLTWDVDQDCFLYKFAPKDKPVTRRGILSVMSSVYDPLGYACPFTLKAKLILQELTRCKVGWDEEIPVYQMQEWSEWLQDLPTMAEFGVPRCVKPPSFGQVATYELHHFADASEIAYGAVSYLVMKDEMNQVHSSLILAKSHLAPLKKLTVPRLELLAATLAVKLDAILKKELEVPIARITFWTDSTIVLQYIRNDDKRFQTFVANRIATIREQSEPQQWHHVDSGSNPADDASRGMGAKELKENSRWLNGPEFICQKEETWPRDPTVTGRLSDNDPEVKKDKSAQLFATAADGVGAVDVLLSYFSSWYRVQKAVAWFLRLRQILRNKSKEIQNDVKGPLSVNDMQAAEEAIIRYVQQKCYPKEYSALKMDEGDESKMRKVKSSALLKLNCKMTDAGLMCVGGRLGNAPLKERVAHPLIVPPDHPVAVLLARHFHDISGHSGKEHVLGLLRQKYWIVKGRRVVRGVLSRCFICKRQQATPVVQKMSDLPSDRVQGEKPPFTYVGVDCFGPFYVKQGRSQVKRYGCLFTCLVIRAVHIEILHSLETDSFIAALQRFITRRGQPEVIRSDNGTNFVGAERELRDGIQSWNKQKIQDHLLQKGVDWKFNPPSASHMGGPWERQIRTVRKILGALLKQQALSDEGLRTLMCLVEAAINGRPLTVFSNDARDPEPLTPNHLLLLRQNNFLPSDVFGKSDLYSRRRWRQIQYLADVFWRRWTREYLPNLQQRQKWFSPVRNLTAGDIVLIVEDLPRNQWLKARVTETYPGKDGLVRSVKVRHRSGTLVRPVQKVCLLEEVVISH